MDISKAVVERLLIDVASLLAIITAAFYALGSIYIAGSMEGYGLPDNLYSPTFRDAVMYGTFTLFVGPFFAPGVWFLSLVGLLPLLARNWMTDLPQWVFGLGVAFFALIQLVAAYEAGAVSSMEEITDIRLALEGSPPEDFAAVKATLNYAEIDGSVHSASGYELGISYKYFILVNTDSILAIDRSSIKAMTLE